MQIKAYKQICQIMWNSKLKCFGLDLYYTLLSADQLSFMDPHWKTTFRVHLAHRLNSPNSLRVKCDGSSFSSFIDSFTLQIYHLMLKTYKDSANKRKSWICVCVCVFGFWWFCLFWPKHPLMFRSFKKDCQY